MNSFVKLGDTDILIIDGDRGENYPSKKEFYNNEYCLFLDSKNITNEGFDFKNSQFITKEKDQFLRNGKLIRNDIVMMTRGSVGKVALYDNTVKYDNIRINSGMIILRCQNDYNAKLLYYMLKSNFVQKQIADLVSGSVQKQLPVTLIKQIKLLNSNCKININLLDCIDKKIKNNNLINIELENMCKTLYDYWFLQFDFPNFNRKPYKSFGGRMVWNEFLNMEIPEGWKVEKIHKCLKSIKTGLNPRDNFELNRGNIKYITVKNINVDGSLDFKNCDTIDKRAKAIVHCRSDIKKGDILFASIAPLGRCYLIEKTPDDWDINESVFSIRVNEQNITSQYLYMYLKSEKFIKKATHSSTGSIFKGIRIKSINDMYILIPPKEIVMDFTNNIKNLLSKKNLNNQENESLIALREFIFPFIVSEKVNFNN